MRVAFLTTVLPSGRRTGGELASQAVVDAVRAAGHDVVVVGYLRPGATAGEGEVVVAERTIESEHARIGERLGWATTALVVSLPLSAAKYAGAAYAKAARAAVADADVVVIDRPQAGWWLRDDDVALPPLVLLAQNVETGVYRDQAVDASGAKGALLRREHRKVAALEERLARRAAQVWTYTEEERAHFDGRLLPVPSVVAAPTGERVPVRDVAVLGTWTWAPNAVGLRWFVDEVVPRLRTRDVHVAGTGADWVAEREGVTYHGFVEDAVAFLDGARVVAVPSTAGRGIQIKTLDALALGAWLVATPVAVRGLDVGPPVARIAGDADAFAAAIDDLLLDAATTDGRNPDALAWSAPRRARLEAAVAEALAELAPPA